MLPIAHIGILIAIGLTFDILQLGILLVGLAGNVVNLIPFFGQFAAAMINILAICLTIGFSILNMMIFSVYTKIFLRKNFKKHAFGKIFARISTTVVELFPVLNILPFWTIYAVTLSILGDDNKKV